MNKNTQDIRTLLEKAAKHHIRIGIEHGDEFTVKNHCLRIVGVDTWSADESSKAQMFVDITKPEDVLMNEMYLYMENMIDILISKKRKDAE